MDLTMEDIDAAIAACELSKPDTGTSGAPAVMADSATYTLDEDREVDRLIEEIVAFTQTRMGPDCHGDGCVTAAQQTEPAA